MLFCVNIQSLKFQIGIQVLQMKCRRGINNQVVISVYS